MPSAGSTPSVPAVSRGRARTPRLLLLTVGTLFALGVSAPGASAASLSVSVQDVEKGYAGAPITFTGTADEPSTIENYQQFDGPPCPATPQQFMQEVASGARRTPGSRPGNTSVTAAGSFRKEGTAPSDEPGRYQLCSYMTADSDKRIVAAGSASFTVSAGPPPVSGCFVRVTYPGKSLDLFNGVAMQFNAKAGCANDDSVRLEGTGTVTMRASDRKKYKLPSATILSGKMGPCGEGARCIFFKLKPAVRRKLKAAASKGRLDVDKLRLKLTLEMTVPFERTITRQLVGRTPGHRDVFFCESTDSLNRPCSETSSRGDGRG